MRFPFRGERHRSRSKGRTPQISDWGKYRAGDSDLAPLARGPMGLAARRRPERVPLVWMMPLSPWVVLLEAAGNAAAGPMHRAALRQLLRELGGAAVGLHSA